MSEDSKAAPRRQSMQGTVVRHGEIIARLDSDLSSLTTVVKEVRTTQEKQWSEISKFSSAMTELTASLRAAPKQDFGRLIGLGLSVGALVAMLVGGITYVVTGSQTPVIKDIQSELVLTKYRLEQLEKRSTH